MTARALAAALSLILLLAACAPGGAERAPEAAEPAEGADLTVHFFDAGKADAILLHTPDSAVLIDAGEKGFGKTILAYLEEKGVGKIDCLIITHFDKDHVGGAAKVLNSIEVGEVLQSNQPKDSEEYEKYRKALDAAGIEAVTVRDARAFTLDGVSYAVDPPRRTEYAEKSSNNSSLIVTVTNGASRFLFAGDAQTERLTEFLSAGAGPCDVLKVAHHGADEPMLEPLLAAVKPAWAVITSSDEEPESAAVVAALEKAGARVLCTRRGAVTIVSDGAAISCAQEQ